MDSESLESRFSSIVPRVEFVNIADQYSYNKDLICKYLLIDYEVQEGDRIAIFKLGWQFIKDYILFEWVPRDPEENVVVFNKLCLPRSTIEIYQFCFISGENHVHGASEPFQFCDRVKKCESLFTVPSYKTDVSALEDVKCFDNSLFIRPDKNQEFVKLKEENEFLHKALKMIVTQNRFRNYDPDIQNLKRITADLQSTLTFQQNQIKELQMKITDSKMENKKLKKEKSELENTCENLKKKLETQVNTLANTELDFEIGELESMPPFPFAK